jgi:hypothetical protein
MSEKRGQVREKILRVLLNHPKESLTKYKITKLSEANISWVIETIRKLEQENLVKGTAVRDFKGLVHLWQKWRIEPERKDYMLRKPLEVLKATKLRYALTTYQAENLVQSHLFPSRVDLYIEPKDKEKWHTLMTEEGLVGKGNTRVLIADKHVFYNSKQLHGFYVVSMPQLIVDLLNEGGVCVEAAEKLIEGVPKDVSTL